MHSTKNIKEDAAFMRSAVKRGKKFIICAVAVLLAAIAACVAVSFTYASFREQAESEGGADVAGAVAEYVRGTATNSGEPIEYEISENGGIVFSNLQPGDILAYNFSIDGFKEIEEGVYAYNEVLLRITLEFSFTYAYPVSDNRASNGYRIQTDHLSCVPSEDDYHVNFYTGNGEDSTLISSSTAASSSDEVDYYNPDDATSSWAVKEYVESEATGTETTVTGRTQKFGFYMSPASADDLQSYPFSFMVNLPTGGTGEYADQFVLNVSIKMTAEQILNTDSSTTG